MAEARVRMVIARSGGTEVLQSFIELVIPCFHALLSSLSSLGKFIISRLDEEVVDMSEEGQLGVTMSKQDVLIFAPRGDWAVGTEQERLEIRLRWESGRGEEQRRGPTSALPSESVLCMTESEATQRVDAKG